MDKIDAGILTDLHKTIVEIAEAERPSRYSDQELVKLLETENQELRQALYVRVAMSVRLCDLLSQYVQGHYADRLLAGVETGCACALCEEALPLVRERDGAISDVGVGS